MSAVLQVRLDVCRLTEYDANGYLGLQYDAFGGGKQAGVPATELRGQYGIYSRPPAPEVDESGEIRFGADVLTFFEGPNDFCFALHDPRLIPGFPELKPGEVIAYGPKFNFTRYHDDGRITQMCTTDGTANGKTIQAEQSATGWVWSADFAICRNDPSGWYYRHASGARLELGCIAGLPAPLSSLGSYCKLEAALVSIKGVTVQIGSGAFEPASKALALLTVLAAQAAADTAQATADTACAADKVAVAAALTAIQGVLVAINPLAAGASAGNVAAAAAALGVSATALGAAATALAAAVAAIAAGAVTVPARAAQVA